MPTQQELSDFESNCDWTWATTNGVNGYIVRGRVDYASVSIILPAAGIGHDGVLNFRVGNYYWFSVSGLGLTDSWGLIFNSSNHSTNYGNGRYYGYPVRPVQGFAE